MPPKTMQSSHFLACVLGALALSACERQQVATPSLTSDQPSILELVDKDEPGERIVLTGTVYEEDGTTPLPGARIHVYQTDAGGYYARPVSRARDARIRGDVWTDEDGRYEIRTIMPGHYPQIEESRHIHVHLAPPGVPDHWIDSFLFAGDPKLTDEDIARNEDLGNLSAIVSLEEGPDGVRTGNRDIRLDPELAQENALVNGWYQGE